MGRAGARGGRQSALGRGGGVPCEFVDKVIRPPALGTGSISSRRRMPFFAPQRASWRRTPKRRRPRSPSYSGGSRRLLHPPPGPPHAPLSRAPTTSRLADCRLRRREQGSTAVVGPHELQASLHLLLPSGAPSRLHVLSGLGAPSRRSRGGRPPSSASRPCTSPPSDKGGRARGGRTGDARELDPPT
jgi:hypothetical protein